MNKLAPNSHECLHRRTNKERLLLLKITLTVCVRNHKAQRAHPFDDEKPDNRKKHQEQEVITTMIGWKGAEAVVLFQDINNFASPLNHLKTRLPRPCHPGWNLPFSNMNATATFLVIYLCLGLSLVRRSRTAATAVNEYEVEENGGQRRLQNMCEENGYGDRTLKLAYEQPFAGLFLDGMSHKDEWISTLVLSSTQ